MTMMMFGRRVLLDDKPAAGGGGSGVGSTIGVLNADQQKIADATAKIAASQPKEEPSSSKPVRSVIKPVPEKALEGDFKLDDNDPADLLQDSKGKVTVEDTNKSNIHPDAKKTTEVKKEEKTTVVEDKKEEKKTSAATTTKITPEQRDYTGFNAEETALLKQMSSPAYQFVIKSLKELKTLQSQKPDHYLQHKDAFVLLPEFQEASQQVNLADFEAKHWKQQLLNIRAGKAWQGLQGYDEKGNPVYSGPFKATDEAEIEVGNALSHASTMTGQLRDKLGQIQNGFKTKIDADNAAIEAECKNRFGWCADPKLLEEKVNVQGVGDVAIKQIVSDFRGLFAPHHQNNPILGVAANMFVALQIYGARIRELEGQVTTEKKLKEDVIRAEPTTIGGGATTGGTAKGDMVFDGEPV